MLKSIAFENFGNFIDFQKLEFDEGANFIIGSNAVGKGLILDLIRRCVSTKKCVHHNRIHDEDKPAYIISEYDVKEETTAAAIKELYGLNGNPGSCNITACIFIQRKGNVTRSIQVKVGDKAKKTFLDIPGLEDQDPTSVESVELEKAFKQFLDCLEVGISAGKRQNALQEVFISLNKNKPTDASGSTSPTQSNCLRVFQKISEVSVSVFAKRSIGPNQWDKSVFDEPEEKDKDDGAKERTKEDRRKKKHDDANDRAEILQELLPLVETDELKTAQGIFGTLIYPFEFTFEKEDRPSTTSEKETKYDIYMKNGKKYERLELLRVPEGIIEAMHFSLILAQEKYQTICLKQPDKGMHPQMIEKMRDLVLRSHKLVNGKVLLLVSHNPAMIHRWSIHRTFVCRQKRDYEGNSIHSVLKVKSDDNMRVRLIHEEMKNTMFAASVLFVEGIHDKSVMTMVFDQILQDGFSLTDYDYKKVKGYEGKTMNEEEKLKSLRKLVSGLAVVHMDGQTCRKNMTDMASTIDLPHILLLDVDVAYPCTRLADRWKHVQTLLKDFSDLNDTGKDQIKQVEQKVEELQKNLKKTKGKCEEEMREKLEKKGLNPKTIDVCIDVCLPYQAPKGNNNAKQFCDAIDKIETSGDYAGTIAVCVKALLNPHKDKVAKMKIADMLGLKEWRKEESDTAHEVIKEDLLKAGIHVWEKGNLEEVICNAVLTEHYSADKLEDFRKFFNLADSKFYGKKSLSHIEERQLRSLVSKYLLKCEEMDEFLVFLLQHADQDFPLRGVQRHKCDGK